MTNRENIINDFYTNYDEDSRLTRDNPGRLEFITTTHYIDRFLRPGMRILEVGAGTGRYSLHYARAGYQIDAIEYVGHNVEILRSHIEQGMNITAQQGDALDLSRFEDATFDVTLVLGPLYHLYTEEDQNRAISEAVRVTRPGGIVAIAYLTMDSIMTNWALDDGNLITRFGIDFDENFRIINTEEGVFASFYVNEFCQMMENHNISPLHNVATDGLSHHLKDRINALTEEEFAMWIKYHLATCERQDLQGYSSHMLYICRRN